MLVSALTLQFQSHFAEAGIRPLRIGRRLWVGPCGTEPPAEPGLVPIWLEPGPAFGTGSHPTTQLCLRALEQHLKPGAGLLDLGAGSGILSIAAARLGAGAVLALDTDPEAVRVARGNILHNQVGDRVQVEQGSLAGALARRWGQGRASWVVTNILAHVIVEFFGQGMAGVLSAEGWLILSGILRSQTPAIHACLAASGLELLAQEQQEEWVCIIARRGGFALHEE
jgi:ribosomal protein L11 methyltransferase